MGNLSQESPREWEDSIDRTTHYGLPLVLRVDYETGQSSMVSFDAEGVTEIVSGEHAEAIDAYLHPSITPGLESAHTEINEWDIALDAVNELESVDREWTLQKIDRIARGQKIGPGILWVALESQTQAQKQLERAA